MKKHAEICPVCKGSGKYRDYSNCNHTSTIYVERTCHGCNGIGWVEVVDDYTSDLGTLPQGTIVFSDSEEDMNKYYQEFCDEKGIIHTEFCDDIIDKHIPRID